QAKTDRIAVRFCLAYFRPEGSNPERADAVKKKPTAWLFQANAAAAVPTRKKIPYAPPKRNQTNFYFWTTGFAVKVKI
ncbi:MAG: hypothetical protein IKQ36_02720, partial [Clostridia bacterium]|nr:hypothetical protein [Clostridia bacterium]